MPTLGSLYGRMLNLSRRVSVNADRLMVQTAISVHRQVTTSTPIDTAAAIMDWRVGVGGPPASSRQALYPTRWPGSRHPPPPKGPALVASASAARQAVAGYPGEVPIYVSNGRSYIGALNDGTSNQAPAQFVQLAVQAGIAYVRTQRILR